MVWELDIDLDDPGSNPHSPAELSGCPWVSHYLSVLPTSQGYGEEKKEERNIYNTLNSLERDGIKIGKII